MNCRDVTERLALFVYGDLPEGEGEGIAAHLAACSACAAERERIERVKSDLDSFAPIESPADVGAIAAWARASMSRPRATTRRSALVGIAAGVAIFVACSALSARFERTPRGFVVEFGGGAGAADSATVDRTVAQALARVEELQRAWLIAQDERFADVLTALRLEGERQRLHDSLQAQEFFDGVVQAVSFPPPRPHRP